MATQRRRSRLIVAVLAAGGAVCVTAAIAETAAGELPAGVKRVLDCRQVQPDAARLACYDAAVSELAKLLTTGQVVSVDQEQVKKVQRQAFGFRLPSLDLFSHGEKGPAPVTQLSSVVEEARQNAQGKWVLTLEDGAVWAQIDTEKLNRWPKKGSKVEIRKAALGTYFVNVDGQRAIRAERVK